MDRPKIVSLKDPAFSLPESPKADAPELPPADSSRNLTPIPFPKQNSFSSASGSSSTTSVAPVLPAAPSDSPLSEIKPPVPSTPKPSAAPLLEPAMPRAADPQSTLLSPPAASAVVLPEPVKAPAGAPPWVERQPAFRPEEKDDDLGRELTGPRVVSVKREDPSRIEHDFAEQAARDILPPSVGPPAPSKPLTPLTADQERMKAKELAQKIHEDNQNQGFFGRIKRALGFR